MSPNNGYKPLDEPERPDNDKPYEPDREQPEPDQKPPPPKPESCGSSLGWQCFGEALNLS